MISDAQKERPSSTAAETGSRGVAADEPDARGVATDESDAQSSVDGTPGPVRPALMASPCEMNGLGEELDEFEFDSDYYLVSKSENVRPQIS